MGSLPQAIAIPGSVENFLLGEDQNPLPGQKPPAASKRSERWTCSLMILKIFFFHVIGIKPPCLKLTCKFTNSV